MIDNVSAAAGQPATNAGPAASTPTVYHTPFGDVMASQISTPNIAAWSDPYTAVSQNSAAPSQAPAPSPHMQTGNSPTAPTAAEAAPAAPADAASSASDPPTLQSEFGSQPYMNNPVGSGLLNYTWSFNPIYFATPETASKVASLLGGNVVEKNAMITGGEFQQDQPNEMIDLANGTEVNAGVIANFYSHGYPQSYIDTLINAVKDGTQI